MRYSTQIKPISDFKANAAGIIEEIAQTRDPVIITQNGRATAVIQDVKSYEETEQAIALLKLLLLRQQDVIAGRTKPAREVIERLRKRIPAE